MAQAALQLGGTVVALQGQTDFAGWRDSARTLALNGVPPAEVEWVVGASDPGPSVLVTGAGVIPHGPNFPSSGPSGHLLPAGEKKAFSAEISVPASGPGTSFPQRGEGGSRSEPGEGATNSSLSLFAERETNRQTELRVPREFVERAEAIVCHSDPERFAFLYRMLWRLAREPNLMKIASDPDLRRFEEMEKSVRRDTHKMRAFVRFRQIATAGGERYVAWFEPAHYIVERNAPFFVRRFTGMRWTILTPYASADWDGGKLVIGPGASKADAPPDDAAEALWLTYFSNIFNPARLKVKAMQAEMPKKYWRNLPEASLIPDLIAGAGKRAEEMIANMPTLPAPHHAKVQEKHWSGPAPTLDPEGEAAERAETVGELREDAAGCRRCPLWRDATQTVFGEGPDGARIVFVGEQPGDSEDIAGRPFVGPAGRVFDETLEEAGIARDITYVTNAVKHFKFEPRGKRRIHAKPNAGEVKACRWWVDHELKLIQPDLAVALGATAALSLLGKAVPITRMRGEIVTRDDGLRVFLTVHPSYILRIREPDEAMAERGRFLADMKKVKGLMAA